MDKHNRKIIYYVAASLDGFIAGPKDDISGFVQQGKGVEQYMSDLQSFDTVIMGRRTYEFGYQYGLEPGQPAYSHMQHYLFSNSLSFEKAADSVKVCPLDIEIIRHLKATEGSDIYLCGGGQFAAWLLEHEMIDELKLKLNPLILGEGIPLFTNSKKAYRLKWQDTASFEDGLQIISYKIEY